MNRRSGIVGPTLTVILILMTVGCDQETKEIARSYLKDGTTVSIFGGVLVMRQVEKEGALSSLGAWLSGPMRRAVFIAIPLVILT